MFHFTPRLLRTSFLVFVAVIACSLSFSACEVLKAKDAPNKHGIYLTGNCTIDFLRHNLSFRSYSTYSSQIQYAIQRGGNILYSIYLNQPIINLNVGSQEENQANWLKSIVDVTWALYEIGCMRNSAFSNGTFLVQDEHQRLITFFVDYYDYVNSVQYDTYSSLKCSTNTTGLDGAKCYAYCRKSYHYPEMKGLKQIGIDLAFMGTGVNNVLGFPPNGQGSIIVGNYMTDSTFIIPEAKGLCKTNTLFNTSNMFTIKNSNKYSRTEAQLPGVLVQPYNDLVSAKIVKSSQVGNNFVPIYQLFPKLQSSNNKKAKTFLSILANEVPDPYPTVRRGNEVLIDDYWVNHIYLVGLAPEPVANSTYVAPVTSASSTTHASFFMLSIVLIFVQYIIFM